MNGILADLFFQLGWLAMVFGGVIAALVAVDLTRQGIEEGRAWWRTDRAIERIARQRALGLRERITGDVIAERRR